MPAQDPLITKPASHAAIVLAAGTSSRLGLAKQQLQIDGQSLEARALTLAAQTQPAQLLLLRAQNDRRPIPDIGATPIHCVQPQTGGMGMSLRAAAGAVDDVIEGYLVLTVDLPYLTLEHLQTLLAGWRLQPDAPIATAYAGTVGIPAILPRSWRQRLLQLDADQGARQWLRDYPGLISIANAALAIDIDTPADLARVLQAKS